MKFFLRPTLVKIILLLLGLFMTFRTYYYVVVDPSFCISCEYDLEKKFGRVFFGSFAWFSWLNFLIDLVVIYLMVCLISWIYYFIKKRIKK